MSVSYDVKMYPDGWYLCADREPVDGPFDTIREAAEALYARPDEHRFAIQAWIPDARYLGTMSGKPVGWKKQSDVAECDTAESVGCALLQLTEDGEFYQHDSIRHEARKAAVWDRLERRYVGGPPW